VAKKQAITIPDAIRKCFEEYGFDESLKLDDAKATRSAEEWFAILFQDQDGEYFAVDFREILDFQTKEWSWEVQNDYVGPFATVNEFKTEKLTRTFL